MLDACAMLMAEFNCTIILVHHTGVSEETQHRARGSSAWRGALDIEISIVPAKGEAPMEIIQRKSKDAELAPTLYATLEKVIIPGWFDEDGEPVTSAVLVQAGEPTKAIRVKLRSPNANDGLEAFKFLTCNTLDTKPGGRFFTPCRSSQAPIARSRRLLGWCPNCWIGRKSSRPSRGSMS